MIKCKGTTFTLVFLDNESCFIINSLRPFLEMNDKLRVLSFFGSAMYLYSDSSLHLTIHSTTLQHYEYIFSDTKGLTVESNCNANGPSVPHFH